MYIFGYFFQKGHFKGYDPPVPLSPPLPPTLEGLSFHFHLPHIQLNKIYFKVTKWPSLHVFLVKNSDKSLIQG